MELNFELENKFKEQTRWGGGAINELYFNGAIERIERIEIEDVQNTYQELNFKSLKWA